MQQVAEPGQHAADAAATLDELQLLAKLEAANRLLESDERSTKSLVSRGSVGELISPEHVADEARKNADNISLRSSSSINSQISGIPHDGDILGNGLEELVSEWAKVIEDWDNQFKRRPAYIKELVRKGVPHHFRYIVWQYLCGAHNSRVKDSYAEYLRQTSACEKVIYRDIARTYPEHEFFKEKNGPGQESLFHVMKAYSVHDREVGYCQGIGFIVGLLLMHMPEEESFAVLVQLMKDYRMRELFKPLMSELGLCMYKLEYLIQEHMPVLYQHFQAQSFHTSMYASSWFLTLFTTTMPITMCFRVMDLFLSEGMEVILRIGVALLLESEPDLLCLDMEGMLSYINEKAPEKYTSDFEGLLQQAYQLKFNAKQMKKLEKEFTLLKSRENEDQVELRRLRSENKLLRLRIENLEKENVTLADRLIHGQVSRAQDAEEMFAIKRELYQMREANGELTRKLQDASSKSPKSLVADFCQEELVAAKLREAEATQTTQELLNRVNGIEREWKKYQERLAKERGTKTQMQSVLDELMLVKLKEAETVAECQSFRQRLVDAEVQGEMSAQQLRRATDELNAAREQQREAEARAAQLLAELAEAHRHMDDLTSQQKEDAVIGRINDAEHSQAVADLRQRVAELEIRNEELLLANRLANGTVSDPMTQSLDGAIPSLRDQALQAKLERQALGFSTLDIYKGRFGESDSEGDELEEIKSRASLATAERHRNLGMKAFSTTDIRGAAYGSGRPMGAKHDSSDHSTAGLEKC